MRFWDASALVPLHVAEPHTPALRDILDENRSVVAWWATVVECASALARHHRGGGLAAAEYKRALDALALTSRGWIVVAPSQHLRSDAMRFVRAHPLRTADAFQLAAAWNWAQGRPGGLEFVTLDGRLREAAQFEGFTVLPS